MPEPNISVSLSGDKIKFTAVTDNRPVREDLVSMAEKRGYAAAEHSGPGRISQTKGADGRHTTTWELTRAKK